MALRKVELSADVMALCMQHALTTEKEEIMGLLMGDVNEQTKVMSIVASLVLRRSDKKPDRVEISEDQLVNAVTYADDLSNKLKRVVRVVGWYHSHPKITVWPSHVDLGTQGMYQQMDQYFVGLIFAVFIKESSTKANEIQVTCFQSNTHKPPQRREIPLSIVPADHDFLSTTLKTLIKLPKIFDEEEAEEAEGIDKNTDDLLVQMHNEAVRMLQYGNIADKVTRPVLQMLTQNNIYGQTRLKSMLQFHRYLENKIKEKGIKHNN